MVVVAFGRISVSVVSAASTASAALAPWIWKPCSWCRMPPASRQIPTSPLQMIMTAANTVSRASDALPSTLTMTDTISATSITVTATARTSEPNGSPTRCATTSAW